MNIIEKKNMERDMMQKKVKFVMDKFEKDRKLEDISFKEILLYFSDESKSIRDRLEYVYSLVGMLSYSFINMMGMITRGDFTDEEIEKAKNKAKELEKVIFDIDVDNIQN